jgi:hypothetical protein
MPYRLPITAMTRAVIALTHREPLKNYALTCHDPRAEISGTKRALRLPAERHRLSVVACHA